MARTSQQFVADRLANFGKGNLEALVADYAPDAVIISPFGTLRGPAQAREMIRTFLAEFALPGTTFTVLSQGSDGRVAHFTWKAETAKTVYHFAGETYVVENGKASYHVLAASFSAKK